MIFLYSLLLISIAVFINLFKLSITCLSHMSLFLTLFFNSQQYIVINVSSFHLNSCEYFLNFTVQLNVEIHCLKC